MPFQINVFNIKTNGLANNANINIGAAVHNSHTANSKWVGATFGLGDLSTIGSLLANSYIDFDVSDQDQIANPSAPITNQL
ncbi:spore germination protein [Falsibacillus pallidus]|uniref:Spore germination protein GerPA/GerPF n=1 Tax=Falsibacillus pallidus TaxID=493781 RepID=A0A370GLB2_9BACI|nr:spore germination protein [Falsibacillus pallidus]RDI43174.1 spore germination protein GerPA/GerPF [Falsibacillus pallidus]